MTTKLDRTFNVMDQESRSKMRPLMTVRIRGIAFKAAIGTKRAQLLGELQHLAEKNGPPLLLVVTACALAGWGLGILTGWWWL